MSHGGGGSEQPSNVYDYLCQLATSGTGRSLTLKCPKGMTEVSVQANHQLLLYCHLQQPENKPVVDSFT